MTKELVFGDKLHIDGAPVLFIGASHTGKRYLVVDENGHQFFVDKEDFDEYKPDPVTERRDNLLGLWKRQSLEHSYDSLTSQLELEEMLEFIEENRDAITSIITE